MKLTAQDYANVPYGGSAVYPDTSKDETVFIRVPLWLYDETPWMQVSVFDGECPARVSDDWMAKSGAVPYNLDRFTGPNSVDLRDLARTAVENDEAVYQEYLRRRAKGIDPDDEIIVLA